MTEYLVADDDEMTLEALRLLLQDRIEAEFGPAHGTFCGEVEEVRSAVKIPGARLDLIVLDMDFDGDILGGGLTILDELTKEQRDIVVVYSRYLRTRKMHTDRMLSDEIIGAYGVPSSQLVDKKKGWEGLWPVCASILHRRKAS